MAEDQPRKLKRSELAARLAEAMRENEQLKAELAKARAQLADRTVEVHDAGSIAEASLKLNDVFEAAQSAADQYLDNIERLYRGRGELVHEAQAKAQAILAQAKIDAEASVVQANADAQAARESAERAREETAAILERASARADEVVEQARAEAEAQAARIVEDARAQARAITDEAERVSRNLELATKVRCDNTLRRASNEAHVYGETLRMALAAIGVTPEAVPKLEKVTGMKAATQLPHPQIQPEPPFEQPIEHPVPMSEESIPEESAPEESAFEGPVASARDVASAAPDDPGVPAGPVESPAAPAEPAAEGGADGLPEDGEGEPAAEEDPVAAIEEAVSSARAAVAAALKNARTAPDAAASIDDDSIAAMYPNSSRQL